jgi:phosphodiesterase/alkaline phosphatase D-like protein
VFRHGVASGDPLADRVMLWTRVTVTGATAQVRYVVASDPKLARVVARGEVLTGAEREFGAGRAGHEHRTRVFDMIEECRLDSVAVLTGDSAVVAGNTIGIRLIIFAMLPAWGLASHDGRADACRGECAVFRRGAWKTRTV